MGPESPECLWLVVGRTPSQPVTWQRIPVTDDGPSARCKHECTRKCNVIYCDLVPWKPRGGTEDASYIQADFNTLAGIDRIRDHLACGTSSSMLPLHGILVDARTWRYLRPTSDWLTLLLSPAHGPTGQVAHEPQLIFENGISSITFLPGEDGHGNGAHPALPDGITFSWDNWSHFCLSKSVWGRYFSTTTAHLQPGVRQVGSHHLIVSTRVLEHVSRVDPQWASFWHDMCDLLDTLYLQALHALVPPGCMARVELVEDVTFPIHTTQPVLRWVRLVVSPASSLPEQRA
jgi:hypothetical protein